MTSQTQSVSVPAVYLSNGRPMTFSYSVAEVFEKEHFNVLRDIDGLGCSAEFRRLNFEATFRAVPGPNGATRQERCFEMTKDGFTILAMGYTGAKAMAFKEAYIQRFNEMEASLRQGGPSIPPSPLGYRRIFLTLRDNGTYHVSPVPDGAVVFAPAELPKIIADSQAGTIPRSLLPAIIGAAAERLGRSLGSTPAPVKPVATQAISTQANGSGTLATWIREQREARAGVFAFDLVTSARVLQQLQGEGESGPRKYDTRLPSLMAIGRALTQSGLKKLRAQWREGSRVREMATYVVSNAEAYSDKSGPELWDIVRRYPIPTPKRVTS